MLRFKEKVSYGFGDMASSMFWKIIGMYMLYFYTDVFGLAPAAVGTMFLITRVWDSAIDPVFGILADRTQTRWGKFRPWILWGAIPFALLGILTFLVPPTTWSPSMRLLYAYVTYTLMMMIYSAVNVPYASLLGEQGAEVVMTRTDDYALCDEDPPIRKKLQDMQRRAALIAQAEADMVISIHMNEYAGRSESGPQVFYRQDCPAGRLLAGAVQERMIALLDPVKERSALGGDYYILTLGVPSVLVECGFLSNEREEALLLTEEYRERVADAVVQGVVRWVELPGEKPEPLEAVDRSGEAS